MEVHQKVVTEDEEERAKEKGRRQPFPENEGILLAWAQ